MVCPGKFTTNKGRNTVFGAYATQAEEVFTMPRNMTRVYFNWWDNPGVHAGLEYVALEPIAQHKEAVHSEAGTGASDCPRRALPQAALSRMDANSMLFGSSICNPALHPAHRALRSCHRDDSSLHEWASRMRWTVSTRLGSWMDSLE